jgi:hypothetical protein
MEQAGYNGAYSYCPLYSRYWNRLVIIELTLSGLYTVGYGAGWVLWSFTLTGLYTVDNGTGWA